MNKQLLRALMVLVIIVPAVSYAEIFIEGEHFQALSIPVQPANADKVEVIEVFSYGCIHCFSFDPLIEGWLGAMPEDVRFERLPAVFSQDWALLAQVFYTAEVLDVLDQVHTPVFNGIHVERIDLRNPNTAAGLFEREAGVAPSQFLEVSNSFSVRSRVQQAVARTRAYQINAVPTMIVAGKYSVSGSSAGSNARMLEVVNFLVEKERQATLGDQLDGSTETNEAD